MKSYRFLLFDADETLFDFKYAEREALKTALLQNGIEYKEEYHSIYTKLNQSMWKQLELGRITKDELLATRFLHFFDSIGMKGDTEKMRVNFQANLSAQSRLLPGAQKLCRDLSGQFELYLVTNGVAATQTARLAPSGLLPYFKSVFISEQVGAPKPSKEFFDAVEQGIPGFVKEQAIIIGDSLTSDIRGGNNAGIDTCWYNPHGTTNDTDAIPTYTVADYEELKQLLMQM